MSKYACFEATDHSTISNCTFFTLLMTLIICTTLPVDALADRKQRAQCARWEKQLDEVRYKLRKGYKVSRGNKLRKRKRELSDKLFKYCS
jgi:hypothetical protein